MIKVYVYLINTMADWETGYILAELSSKRFFKDDAPELSVIPVGASLNPVKTMGGLTVIPEVKVEDIEVSENTVLILPGALTWSEAVNFNILNKAKAIVNSNGLVCGICGATVALAEAGLLDSCAHTSNGAGFLEMFSKNYKGSEFYEEKPCVVSKNIITAGAASSLEWAKEIINRLGVFKAKTLEAWFNYFKTGKAEYFYKMMEK